MFAGKVVRKDLVRKVKVGANVPVFVLEYLLGKYCATDDPVAIDAGLKVVNNTLSSNFVRPDEANKAQSMVKDKGKHTFIDKVQVRYVSDDDKHWAELKNFGHKIRSHPRTLPARVRSPLDGRYLGPSGYSTSALTRTRRASAAHSGLTALNRYNLRPSTLMSTGHGSRPIHYRRMDRSVIANHRARTVALQSPPKTTLLSTAYTSG